jgi:hypothetical protein
VACLLTAGDGRDEQRALRWKAARKVQELKLAKARVSALVHGGGWQELESLLGCRRLGIEEGAEQSGWYQLRSHAHHFAHPLQRDVTGIDCVFDFL